MEPSKINQTRWEWHHNNFTPSLHLVPFCQLRFVFVIRQIISIIVANTKKKKSKCKTAIPSSESLSCWTMDMCLDSEVYHTWNGNTLSAKVLVFQKGWISRTGCSTMECSRKLESPSPSPWLEHPNTDQHRGLLSVCRQNLQLLQWKWALSRKYSLTDSVVLQVIALNWLSVFVFISMNIIVNNLSSLFTVCYPPVYQQHIVDQWGVT